MKLLDAVERSKKKTLKRGNIISWEKVAELMNKANNDDMSPESYRSKYRRLKGTHNSKGSRVKTSTSRAFKKGTIDSDAESILINELRNERTISELCYATGLTQLELLGSIEQLRLKGYDIVQYRINDQVGYTTNKKVIVTYDEFKHYHDIKKKIKIGLVSDTHIGSMYWQPTYLKRAYEDFKEQGITDVYHVGDISEGTYTSRPGAVYETYVYGFDQQASEISKVYPKVDGIKTHFITGNHDATHIMNGGANIGIALQDKRSDLNYLGHEYAKIWLTENVDMDLIHPRDGTCFDNETEVFTKRGWINFEELTYKDEVATMTKESHEFQWQRPTHITRQNYEGKMYHFRARCVDMMVTPNHGMWVRRYPNLKNQKVDLLYPSKSHRKVDFDWNRITAEQVYKEHRRQKWQMTNHCSCWHGKDAPEYYEVPRVESKNIGMNDRMNHIGRVRFDDFIELVAWYVTEGHARQKSVSISQSQKANPKNHSRILKLLERMNIRYSISGIDKKNICINSVELSKHLSDICGCGSSNVYLPEFIKDLEISKLRLVFEVMVDGDGWIRNESYAYRSISRKLRSDFSEIAIKLGYAVSENKDTVNVTTVQTEPTINKKPEVIQYKGMIFCASVPNGLIYVRRNGKATWSHNSYALSYQLQKRINNMSGGNKPKILITGHYHKNFSMLYRNIWAVSMASFQAQSPFMRGKGIESDVGYLILEISVNQHGDIIEFNPIYKPLYVAIKDDYLNK